MRPTSPCSSPHLYTLLFVLLISGCAASSPRIYKEHYAQGEVRTPEAYEKIYGFHPAVYLLYEDISEHSGTSSSEWDYTHTTLRRSIVLQPNVEEVSTFSLSLASTDSLRTARFRIYSPSGAAQEFTEQNLARSTNKDGSASYKLAYPNIVRGSIVEEYIEVFDKDPAENLPVSYFQWLAFPLPCEKLRVLYAFPSWWAVAPKHIQEGKVPNYRIERDTNNQKIALVYSDTQVPALPKENYAPFRRECVAYLSLGVNRLIMGGENFRRANSWDESGELIRKHYMGTLSLAKSVLPFLSTPTERLAHELTETAPTPLAKLDAIVRYLQNTIDVEPSDDKDMLEVLETHRGSPFHITGLARTMLNNIGIPAQYLRIHSAEKGYFDPDFISSEEIGMPAVRVEIDSATYIVFPYIKHLPITYLPEFCQGQPALLVDNNVMDTRLIDLPVADTNNYKNTRTYTLSIAENGTVAVQETRTLTGAQAFAMRTQLDGLRPEEKDKVLKELIAYRDGEVQQFQSEVENFSMPMQPLVLRATYTIDNLVTLTPDEVVVRTTGLLSSPFDNVEFADPNERILPIKLYFNEEFEKHITLLYPPSWQLVTELRDTNITTAFGNCTLRYHRDNSTLSAHYTHTFMRTTQPKERYKELLPLINTTNTDVPALVFSRR